MLNQYQALKLSLVQMIEIGKEFLRDKRIPHSRIMTLSDGTDRSYEDRRHIDDLYYREIAAAAYAIRLFTGREFSFQWRIDKKNDMFGGFAIYEILEGCPCEHIPPGAPTSTHCRYTGQREYDRRIDWGKSRDEGKIIKIFEHVIDADKHPAITNIWLTEEFKAPVLTSTAVWSYTYYHSDPLYGTDLYSSGAFDSEEERTAWREKVKSECAEKGCTEPYFIDNDFS